MEITTAEDIVRYFLCIGEEQHRFTWEHDIEAEPHREPLIILAR